MKGMISVLFLFLLMNFALAGSASTSSSSSSGGGCGDTDGGLNYYEKGTASGQNTDYCKDKNILIEYSCGKMECIETEECSIPVATAPRGWLQVYYTIENIATTFDGEDYTPSIIGFTKSGSEVGTYSAKFEKEGFKTCETNIEVIAERMTKVSVKLVLENSSENQNDCITVEDIGEYSSGAGTGPTSCPIKRDCNLVDTEKEFFCELGCIDGRCDKQGHAIESDVGNITTKLIDEGEKEMQEEVRERILSKVQTRLTFEDSENASRARVKLSNGRNAEIKIMPEVASVKALQRLRLKNCNESANCTIELKEVGESGSMFKMPRAVYEVKAKKTFRILGFIKNRHEVSIQIDATTGEEVETRRPWWAWLARESEE